MVFWKTICRLDTRGTWWEDDNLPECTRLWRYDGYDIIPEFTQMWRYDGMSIKILRDGSQYCDLPKVVLVVLMNTV